MSWTSETPTRPGLYVLRSPRHGHCSLIRVWLLRTPHGDVLQWSDDMTQSNELRTELEFFESQRGEWLRDHCDKWALVKGQELIGIFDSVENAYEAGVERFTRSPFLVKQILEKEPLVQVPVLSLGLVCAHV